jgi:acetylglutamate kinase
MKRLEIIKIGGQVVENEEELDHFLSAFSVVDSPKILVHGGGKTATIFSEKYNITPKMIDGRRITDAESLKVVQMVYAGLINKNIVAVLQGMDCPAIGLSGIDCNALLAEKRPVVDIDYGFVGDIICVNTQIIIKLIEIGLVPVFCALTHDGKGQILNTNADSITTELGIALAEKYLVDLVFCFEKQGVLKNINDENSIVPLINSENYTRLRKEGIISAGMIPKIDNAFRALKGGVGNVYITHSHSLKDIFSVDNRPGTRIFLE